MPVKSSYGPKKEIPAIQLGGLVGSLKVEHTGRGKAELVATAWQAKMMEFGFTTRDGAFHIRPFMRPTLEKYRDEIEGAVKNKMRTLKLATG